MKKQILVLVVASLIVGIVFGHADVIGLMPLVAVIKLAVDYVRA